MRSLWTSAHGMSAMQTRLDSLGHNMANLNTTGYKSEDVQFKDMLYLTMQQKDGVKSLPGRLTTADLRLGHGVLAVGTVASFAQGEIQTTQNALDLAIQGDGFFKIRAYDQSNTPFDAYTRDGSFKVGTVGTDQYLVTADGNPVLDTNNQPILLTDYDAASVKVDQNGVISALPSSPANGTAYVELGQIEVTRIAHPESNLTAAGENLYRQVANANPADIQANGTVLNGVRHSTLQQRALEMSNVDMSQQMTEMIVAQRAYSLNARALTTTDQMMGIANNLRA
ncbi:flagellar hook-basal body protein [Tumebacillus sp. ITR2]|uniref:Flagellar hook-basal body protein n=1 Tax=Tumebacillus amylolyticus TaxID=2801339 RepID=A0ABS1J598_9BACL|nr:flagellar hook-basal body protein [Tumebacillus amylolyticus]MBL0385464.1 flagellar hook-basal body protein [Tumebacillus amylolyticus]